MIFRQHGGAGDRGANVAPETVEFWHALDQEDDLRDAYALIQEQVQRYRDAGRPLPEQLRRRERDMMTEFVALSGISTPSLPAQGEQRRLSYFNRPRDILRCRRADR